MRIAIAALALAGGPAGAAWGQAGATSPAALFGEREMVKHASLSPDGAHVAFVTAGPGHRDVLMVMDVATSKVTRVAEANGEPLRLAGCGWASGVRLVCTFTGQTRVLGIDAAYSRLMGFDIDGGHPLYLGRRPGSGNTRANQFDGEVIDWRGGDGSVLMTRDFVPGEREGALVGEGRNGRGVELVDTVTGKATMIEPPAKFASGYLADGNGTVRIREEAMADAETRELSGTTVYSYRPTGAKGWKTFSRVGRDTAGPVPVPLAVDGTRDLVYAVQPLNGRLALYSIALDGSMKADLVSSSDAVDVGGVVSIGRRGRVIGATYVTDRRQVDYFDPEYRTLAAGLARALPKTPLIRFVGASADEGRLLVFASSDVDPGRYYLYTKATRRLDELAWARPALRGVPLAEMTSVTVTAADGTPIPAYLTLPAGEARKGLPAIVMPHGGPSYRDEWGFDWLVQYFAHAGYAVLQPNYRGSAGYGDAWFANNGFRSWQTAIGDVADAGRWLVKEGIADPGKLAIVGWSYGGYAALQANVVDPDLFRAAVAIAPVTDFAAMKRDAENYTSGRVVAREVGSGAAVAAGSPARHADRFKTPVMLFHGDRDLNVDADQSRLMDAALRRAGKPATLVTFSGLDHQLDDTDARVRILGEADAFLRKAMGM